MKRSLLISFSFLVIFVTSLSSGCAPTPRTLSRLSPPNTENRDALRIYRSAPTFTKLMDKPWPMIHLAQVPFKPGMRSLEVPIIRQRLIWLGDLSQETISNGEVYDASMVQAVRQFQWRHGLKSDGEIGESTLRNLNVTPQQRLAQLRLNMHRWERFPDHVGNHYILVNSADFRLNVIKDGNRVMDMRVIVGKSERPTPELYSKVSTVVFNPKWNVPEKIMNEDIIPKVIANPNYLAEENIKIYNKWAKNAYEIKPETIDWQKAQEEGLQYRMTQVSGDQNALGRVKFVFMNEHDVYMHDTPQKGLFNEIRRAYSSGCIRVEEPFKLVEYFLKEDPEETQEKINGYLSSNKIKYVSILKPVPIYVTYITAWVDEKGFIHFREDIYQRDGIGGFPY